jgi:hypothetical protein
MTANGTNSAGIFGTRQLPPDYVVVTDQSLLQVYRRLCLRVAHRSILHVHHRHLYRRTRNIVIVWI